MMICGHVIISYDFSNCRKNMLLSFLAGLGGANCRGKWSCNLERESQREMEKGTTVGLCVCVECVGNLMMATIWRVESFFEISLKILSFCFCVRPTYNSHKLILNI